MTSSGVPMTNYWAESRAFADAKSSANRQAQALIRQVLFPRVESDYSTVGMQGDRAVNSGSFDGGSLIASITLENSVEQQ
ncbi:hypothetical protein GLAREA_10687 [Glarea lozoyensis ATCC 20868]|uniref:Uncharacterized protein n=1 Tax=Glarea lozoyensis (strain ATCC 20868 / MF5171) TaxID=1116229 RepID=S3D942_GLAL2|nr:uncharacterized protein GLAREA_10687 [Glarea lozoyensis ATCC 20868]EPE34992.1 hypothetical protein GLAREA_10687 [Glarea lozoyensis ATCC 20868]